MIFLKDDFQDLKSFLDEKVLQYNKPQFIASDPIQIPHQFDKKEDIEIAAFLAAIISWGNRKMIIKNADLMMELMDRTPYDFVLNFSEQDVKSIDKFVHRTFNHLDLIGFLYALQSVYKEYHGLESLFSKSSENQNLQERISFFKTTFCNSLPLVRTHKHISDPLKGSAAKRINMFLRWMVRNDQANVDFGIWKTIHPSELSCPLDVHSGNVARKLGLLERKQNDAKAVQELDKNLRLLDPNDPVKYDFALFGLGVFERF
uniref:TIGR02757 family protein n=1 Tax=Flavobacterium sp. TaxID=239 RepID=UPI00404A70A3